MENTIKYEDTSLFIGLATPPHSYDIGKFYKDEIEKDLFETYRNDISKDNALSELYYSPKAYYLFGDFDLAILSLIDDFEFGSQRFRPGNSINKSKKKSTYFDYQVITGGIPKHSKKNYIRTLKNQFNKNQKTNREPLIAITKLKINSGLLIGTGSDLIDSINNLIAEVLDANKFVILETFCNSELCLIVFCQSYYKIANLLLKIRDIKLCDLDKSKKVLRSTLIYKLKKEKIKPICKNVDDLHIFNYTHSTFGYDLEYASAPQMYKPIKDIDKVDFFQYWDVKPGHLDYFLEFQTLKDNKVHIPIGKGTFSSKYQIEVKNNRIKLPYDSKSSNDKDLKHQHVNRVKTYINIHCGKKVNIAQNPHKENYHFSTFLKSTCFKDLSFIDGLNQINISNVLRNRIFKMYTNFNDAIQDPLLFSFFIELKGLLIDTESNIKKFIKNSNNHSNREIHDILSNFVEIFEKAYQNRIQQSYRMIGLTDSSLESSGGIQQLISSYDGAFKTILSVLGEESPCGVALVSGFEGVDAIKYEMRLNYFHLFQPELFAAVLVKEAGNYILSREKDYIREHYVDLDEVTLFNKKGYEKRMEIRGKIVEYYNIKALEEEWYKSKDIRNLNLIQFLISSINFGFFRNIVADCLTFSIGYKKNSELYAYWFWNIVRQNSSNYHSGELMNSQLVQLLLRSYCVHKISKVSVEFKVPHDVEMILGKENYEFIKNFIDKLIELEPEPFNDIYEFCFWDRVYEIIRIGFDEVNLQSKEESRNNLLMVALQKTTYPNIKRVPLVAESILSFYEDNRTLDRNELISNNQKKTILHLINLCYNYIEEIFTEFKDDDQATFKFNNQGGITIKDHQRRKVYMVKRIQLIKDLWNVSNINKVDLIIDKYSDKRQTLRKI